MKKTMALWLAVILLALCVCGSAETAQTAPQNPFSIRGGITWGMTPDEVQAIEGEAPYSHSFDTAEGRLFGLNYDGKRVSRVTAELGFVFGNEQLFMLMYAGSGWNTEAHEYIGNALASLYGPAKNGETKELLAFMDAIEATNATVNDFEDVRYWDVDGTVIWYFLFQGWDYLFYVNDQFDLSAVGIYDTFGL